MSETSKPHSRGDFAAVRAALRALAGDKQIQIDNLHGWKHLNRIEEQYEKLDRAFQTEVRVCRERTKMLESLKEQLEIERQERADFEAAQARLLEQVEAAQTAMREIVAECENTRQHYVTSMVVIEEIARRFLLTSSPASSPPFPYVSSAWVSDPAKRPNKEEA